MALSEKIPRILHLYWGRNKPLSYMRAMTAISFARLNPDWDIRLWYPTVPCYDMPWKSGEHECQSQNISEHPTDWFDYLVDEHLVGLAGFTPDAFGFAPDLPEVHRSDLLRWHILATEGGIWSDFDIFYQKPLTALQVPDDADVVACYMWGGCKKHRVGFNSIGFLASAPEREWRFFSKVLKVAQSHVSASEYQSAGRFAMDHVYRGGGDSRYGCNVYNLDSDLIYPVVSGNVRNLYVPQYTISSEQLRALRQSVGIHWYAGHKHSIPVDMNTHEGIHDNPEGFLMREMKRQGVTKCTIA